MADPLALRIAAGLAKTQQERGAKFESQGKFDTRSAWGRREPPFILEMLERALHVQDLDPLVWLEFHARGELLAHHFEADGEIG